jgi:hypothetical protein
VAWKFAGLISVGLVLAIALMMARAPGVYLSSVQVRFIHPANPDDPNALRIKSPALIITAGAVAKMIKGSDSIQVVSPTTTLAAEGVRHGYAVTLPNNGGQWSTSFSSPWLDVQVAGTSTSEVQTVMNRLLGEITRNLDSLQSSLHVSAYNRIHTELSPPSGPTLVYQRGSPIRAAAGMLALGLVAIVVAARLARRWRLGSVTRRRRLGSAHIA